MNDRAIYANANALDLPIGDKSVHMIATSPPYWGLRDYGTATWEGGDPECDHVERNGRNDTTPEALARRAELYGTGQQDGSKVSPIQYRGACPKCGAIRKDAQLGMEPLHDCLAWARGDEPCGGCYVCNMRTWAREMWRVLRDDGVMFLNLGDSYANGNKSNPGEHHGLAAAKERYDGVKRNPHNDSRMNGSVKGAGNATHIPPGLKPKDLTGIPWRVALALQADGWYLRSDIIWAKPNPMPESVTDRATKSHEYIFMLAKSPRYYFDAEAVREEASPATLERNAYGWSGAFKGQFAGTPNEKRWQEGRPLEHAEFGVNGRNIRTVWTIATAPYSGAHYATWPPALVERMVKAGTSERGVCPEPGCGKPWERVVENQVIGRQPPDGIDRGTDSRGVRVRCGESKKDTLGWRPTCAHHDATPVPAIVLDPFCGSGTTLMVARQLGRIGLGFDLSLKYLEDNAAVRLGHDKLAAWGNGIKDPTDYSDLFVNGVNQ